MIKSLVVISLSFLFLTCSSVQEKSGLSNNSADSLANHNTTQQKTKEGILEIAPPRRDSVLQFKSMIHSIFEDSHGNFWFGSWCDGLCKYNPSETFENGKPLFTYFTVENGIPGREKINFNDRDVPRGNSVSAFQEDDSGNIIFMTLDGIVKFDGETFSKLFPEEESLLITESFNPTVENYEEAWRKEFNYLWFLNSQENGALRYDGSKLTPLTFPTTKLDNDSPWNYHTYSIYKDRNGTIWFGTAGAGIFKYTGNNFERINQIEEIGTVRSFFQDESGKVWISNVLRGLYYYDYSAEKEGRVPFVNFTKEMGYYNLTEIRSDSLLDDTKYLDGIQSIAQDRDGNLWFGSFSSGLWRYDGETIFHFNTDNGLPDNTVKTIFKDREGELWFAIGRANARVYHFDGDSFKDISQR